MRFVYISGSSQTELEVVSVDEEHSESTYSSNLSIASDWPVDALASDCVCSQIPASCQYNKSDDSSLLSTVDQPEPAKQRELPLRP